MRKIFEIASKKCGSSSNPRRRFASALTGLAMSRVSAPSHRKRNSRDLLTHNLSRRFVQSVIPTLCSLTRFDVAPIALKKVT